METIFALSSGQPPAAIAVVRISGPQAGDALDALAGSRPPAREARLRKLRNEAGDVLDHAMVLWLPGPANATGEDTVELHLHGGRAVVQAVERALGAMSGLRKAEPGEFTRRAFFNGQIDLAEADGLADLLEAETELQRRHAMALAGGALSAQVESWRESVLRLSAEVESVLDFSDEDDVTGLSSGFANGLAGLKGELDEWLDQPQAERLREGLRVVLAGPPNSGKSTLFNALIDDDAAIATPIPGTTRDVLERSVALDGVPFTFVDTAGLRDAGADEIEAIGMERARRQAADADCVLWLGQVQDAPAGSWPVETKIDLLTQGSGNQPAGQHRVSALTGDGMGALRSALIAAARAAMPRPGSIALNARQHGLVTAVRDALGDIDPGKVDLLIAAEHLRVARAALDAVIGRTSTEDMLDTLFGRFCIGK